MTNASLSDSASAKLETTSDNLKQLLARLCYEMRIGEIQAFPCDNASLLPLLSGPFRWALCDGSALDTAKSPLASKVLSGALPSIPAGSALVQCGDLGYKVLGLGQTGKGALPAITGNITASSGNPGDIGSIFASDETDQETGITPPFCWGQKTDGMNLGYTSTHSYALGFNSALQRYPDAAAASDDEDQMPSEELTPYQDSVSGVIPRHLAVQFYVLIDDQEAA